MNNNQSIYDSNQIVELKEENQLLFEQLTIVQEELERKFHRLKELEERSKKISNPIQPELVGDDYYKTIAELQFQKELNKVQAELNAIQIKNLINVKVGDLFIESINSVGGIVSLPGKLLDFWKKNKKRKPPKSLGDDRYNLVLKAYENGGNEAVEVLMGTVNVSSFISGNAYTALARGLMSKDPKMSAAAAYKAYECDPKPYRLKWLACRVHEAGDVIRAEALLSCLPADMNFSDSERKQANRIRQESLSIRLADSREKAKIDKKQEAIKEKLDHLATNLADVQSKLLNSESSKKIIDASREEQARLAESRQRDIEGLKEIQAQLETRGAAAAEQIGELEGQIRSLVEERTAFEEAKAQIIASREEQAQLAKERLTIITDLQLKIQNREEAELALTNRQQLMQEELVRAEAQIDIIKDILLREPGL